MAAGPVLGRVTQLVSTDLAGSRHFGSGYLVADGVVLTAAHVVDGAADVLVTFEPDRPGQRREQAVSWWADAESDLAVVRIASAGSPVPPARFGRFPDRAALAEVESVGFPRWKMRNADGTVPTPGDGKQRFRESVHIFGSSPLHSNARRRTLEVVLTAPPAESGDPGSPWEGMSGAAVWVGDHIVGVIAQHHQAEGLARLAAVRLDVALGELAEGRSARLRDIVPGLPSSPAALPDVLPPAEDEGAARPKMRRPWMAPVLPGATTARPGPLAALLEQVRPENQVVSIEGTGGFGKTTLAAMLCRDLQVDQRFPGGLLWVSVGRRSGGARLAELIGGLCEALSGERPGTTDPQVAGGRLGELLNEREPALLVIDDVWRPEQLAPFLIGAWSACRLITTRNAGVAPRGAAVVSVDGMTQDQAVATLTGGLGDTRIPPNLLARLVDATGRWPLLLSLVNAALADQLAVGADVLEAVRWVLRRLEAVGPTAFDDDLGADDGRSHAVEATLEMSLALLSPEEIDRYLDLVIIPEGAELGSELLARFWGRTGLAPRDAEKLRVRLVRLSLVQPGWDGDGPTVRLHDVVRAYLRHRVAEPDIAARHERMMETAAELVSGRSWWELPAASTYLWSNLPFHLRWSGRTDERDALVCDLRWVEAKTRTFGSSVPAEVDLDDVPTDLARSLRRSLGSISELLTPVEPATAPDATIHAYLAAVPDLTAAVAAYREHLRGPRLLPLWPVPDQPRRGLLRTLHGHTYGVSHCAYSPSGALIATASNDHTARLWDARTGVTLRVFTGHDGAISTCAISPDETTLVTGGHDRTVRLWDITTGTAKAVLTGHAEPVTSCAFTPDGTVLVTTARDRAAVLWDVGTGEPVMRITHPAPVLDCAVSPDGTSLATACEDGTCRIWDARTGTRRVLLSGHEGGAARSCAFSPDGSALATAGDDGEVRIWDAATGVALRVLNGHTAAVACCAFSPDGTLVASAGHDLTTRVWDRATGEARATLTNSQAATSCAFSPDGVALAVADHDWEVMIWQADVAARPTRHQHHWEYTCAFSPDGTTIATAGHDRAIRVWSVPSGELQRTFHGHTDTISGIAFSADGRLLATAGHDRTVRIWDAATGAIRGVLTGHADAVSDLAFAPDGARLVSASHDDTVRLWDAETGGLLRTLHGHTGAVAACAFSPDGTLVASASHDHTVRVWDAASGVARMVLTGHTDLVSACAFSADGSLIASAGHDRTCRIWDVTSGALHQTLPRHTNGIADCAFGPDGTLVTTDLHDCGLRVWRVGEAEPLCGLRVLTPVLRLAWHPDQPILGAVGESGVYLVHFRQDGRNV